MAARTRNLSNGINSVNKFRDLYLTKLVFPCLTQATTVPFLSQMNTVYSLTPRFLKMYLNIVLSSKSEISVFHKITVCWPVSYSSMLHVLVNLSFLPLHRGTSVTGNFSRIWEFRFSPTTSESLPRVSTQSYLMRGTLYFGNRVDICADRRLTRATWSASWGWWRLAGQLGSS